MKIFANNFGLVLVTLGQNPHFDYQLVSWQEVEDQLRSKGVLFPWQVFYVKMPVSESITQQVIDFQIREETSEIQSEVHLCFASDEEKDAFWEAYQQFFTPVAAAGGVVFNEREEILLIMRHGMVDLPKGKLESGESTEENAVREVAEETGLAGHKIQKAIPSTFHIYFRKSWVLKTTYWFIMTVKNAGVLTPQTEEAITEVLWRPAEHIRENGELNTYPTIRETLRIACAEWFD